jgi:hypothetical protein
MATHLGQPQRHRIADEHTEHTTTPWQHPDLPPSRLVDTHREKPSQPHSRLLQHPERRVPRARQQAGGLKHPLHHNIATSASSSTLRATLKTARAPSSIADVDPTLGAWIHATPPRIHLGLPLPQRGSPPDHPHGGTEGVRPGQGQLAAGRVGAPPCMGPTTPRWTARRHQGIFGGSLPGIHSCKRAGHRPLGQAGCVRREATGCSGHNGQVRYKTS